MAWILLGLRLYLWSLNSWKVYVGCLWDDSWRDFWHWRSALVSELGVSMIFFEWGAHSMSKAWQRIEISIGFHYLYQWFTRYRLVSHFCDWLRSFAPGAPDSRGSSSWAWDRRVEAWRWVLASKSIIIYSISCLFFTWLIYSICESQIVSLLLVLIP